MYRGEAYAGLYILKELDGPGTQMKYFSKSNINVHYCKAPVIYINSRQAIDIQITNFLKI